MNVFDFDKTIYDGDSTVDFCLWLIKRYPAVIGDFISNLGVVLRYKRGKITKTEMKEKLYKCLRRVPDMEKELSLFWDKHIKNIEKWYLDVKREDDVIISASPEFLVSEACRRLGIKHVMASRVDAKTGKYDGLNCYGAEKPKRFDEYFGESARENIECFYSDSYSDAPLAVIAKKAYLIKDHAPTEWDHSKNREI